MHVFNHGLEAHREHGLLSRILEKYSGEHRDNERRCSAVRTRKRPLGFNNVFFPFFVLAGGVGAAVFALAAEAVYNPKRGFRRDGSGSGKRELGRSAVEQPSADHRLRRIQEVLETDMESDEQLEEIKALMKPHVAVKFY